MRLANYLVVITIFVPYVLGAHKSSNTTMVEIDPVQMARQLVNNFLNNTANGFAPGDKYSQIRYDYIYL